MKVGECFVYRFVCLHVLHHETHGAGFDVGKSVACRRDAPVLLCTVNSKRLVHIIFAFQSAVINRFESSGKCDAVAFKMSACCLYVAFTSRLSFSERTRLSYCTGLTGCL